MTPALRAAPLTRLGRPNLSRRSLGEGGWPALRDTF